MKVLKLFCAGVLLIGLAFAMYCLYDTWSISERSMLAPEIMIAKPDDKASLEILKQINNDIVGWISIDGTSIDYPVVRGRDNDWYLNHDYLGNYAISGSIFMDFRNEVDDDFVVIYGHRMSGKLMFSEIGKFADSEFLRKHAKGSFYFNDKKQDFRVLAFREIESDSLVYNLEKRRNRHNLENARELMIDKVDEASSCRKLILLSTCSRENKNRRSVLLLGY